jgi:lysophospholipase L1-like esterase
LALDQFRDVDVVLDKVNDNIIQGQFVSEGDYNGRTMTVMVTDGGVIGPKPGLQASLLWNNQANMLTDEHAFELIDSEKSIFRIEFPNNMLKAGTVVANIRIWLDGKVMTTKSFKISVGAIAGKMSAVIQQQEFGLLTAVLADANKFRTDIDSLGINKAEKTEVAELDSRKAEKTDLNAAKSSIAGLYDTKLDKNANSSISVPMLSAGVLDLISSGTSEIEVNTSMLMDGAIVGSKLAPTFNYKALLSNVDLNSVTGSGLYVSTGTGIVNAPIAGTSLLNVENFNSRILQTYTTLNYPYYTYKRFIQPSNSTYGQWFTGLVDKTVNRNKLTDDYNSMGAISDGDCDDAVRTGNYLMISGATNAPSWISGSAMMNVKVNGVWIHQEYRSLQNPDQVAYRWGRAAIDSWGDWVNPSSSTSYLKGKKILALGDSQFGNTQDASSVTSYISSITGATVYNGGFGGCRMGRHESTDGWDWFSMYRLADELVKPLSDDTRFQPQTSAVNNSAWTSKPAYFNTTVEMLKTIDLDNIDYLVISYGTNDVTGENMADDQSDRLNVNTFGGALRYSLEKLFITYHNLNILLCSPTYRIWFENGEFIEDSDTKEFSGGKVPDFVAKEKEIAVEFKIPILDNYYELGINKFNYLKAFDTSDGVHQNADGRKIMGEKIGKKLLAI